MISPLSPLPKAKIQAPIKLIKTPSNCLLLVENFQTKEPTRITKIGIIELMIPAMLLLISVSAIGNKNIGIKLPESATKTSHFKCRFGNSFIFEMAKGISTIPEIKTRKAPTS